MQLKGLGERRRCRCRADNVSASPPRARRNPTVLLGQLLSNLDLKLREEMRVEIVAIQRQLGITTVFITHDRARRSYPTMSR